MIDYGVQRSTALPQDVELTAYKVFVASNITEINEPSTGDDPGFTGYEFNLVEYGKDEYIRMIQQQNESLETDMINTQLALCDVYELIGG